jgi:hypothetical protein
VAEWAIQTFKNYYDLFPQHCVMPTFTRKERTAAVNDKLKEAILVLNKKVKKHL